MIVKAKFLKRVSAYIFDFLLLLIIFSVVTMESVNDTTSLDNELNNVVNQFSNGEITLEEYSDKVIDITHEKQQRSLFANVMQIVLTIGYFVVFAYLNGGQTIGKKLFGIKLVNKDGGLPSIWNLIVRSLFIYSIVSLCFSAVFVKLLNSYTFSYGFLTLSLMEEVIVLVSFLMVLYRKDGRGVHDLVAGTKVIEEVK